MKHTSVSLAVVLLAPLFLIAATSSAVYDPWSDLNADGEIDIFDVVTVAGAYLTTGDPTKSVYVQNWPATTQQTVWYGRTTSMPATDVYNASGFGHMHLMWQVTGLADDESVTVRICVYIYESTGTTGFPVQETAITVANYRGALSFPVPAETFYFSLTIPMGTTAAVSLAFYLTYA